MRKLCSNTWCQASFEVTESDLKFLDKVSPVIGEKKLALPPPRLCYDCRQQRRLAQRNERNLYKRSCDLCKRPIISIYTPDGPHAVYCPECWWGDNWDPLSFGRAYDQNRPFFEQFGELYAAIPKMSTFRFKDDINSDYTHDGYRLKNCYFIFDGEQAQDCFYGECYVKMKDCCDFLYLTESELCYECIHCQNCFDLRYSSFCQNCSESVFLLDCVSCKSCIGCVNLVQKEYYIFNEPFSKEDYLKRKAAMNLHTHSGVRQLKALALENFLKHPRKALRGVMNENATGDNILSCKDSSYCFDCIGMRDCRFCTGCMMGGQDCQDVDAWGDRLTLAYNCAYIGAGSQNLIGCYYTALNASNVISSIFCMTGVNNLFGCTAIKKNSHCILNKKYSESEYSELVHKIVECMRTDGEWGDFFPPEISAFGYNETVAQDYYPLPREEVLKRGWKWRDQVDEPLNVTRVIEASQLPDSIDDIPDDILNWAIRCEKTRKPFRLQKAELELYRRLRVPVPRWHFEVRHAARRALRNPRKLWKRNCANCQKPITTSYSPERPEKVVCESCYLKEVY
ncbi:hypothetical protein A3A67_04980 [Candidatus Peribacteria bacterium RIFCSPLOWO2_01_FULL_51_18]|nr:MAG: hypothetical protein A3A67_04980 [Candidatus Peribacteria bacterium RIFCSPLOWO2_01_FULL_51_18]